MQKFRTLLFALSFCALVALPLRAAITGVDFIAEVGSDPLAAVAAPGDADHLYVAQRDGVVRVLDLQTSSLLNDPLVTVPGVDQLGEGGLLGMAFHPEFQNNGKFYVHATLDPGDANPGQFNPYLSTILEYTVSGADPLIVDSAPRTVLEVQQPFANHNGGWIGFNPAASGSAESYLYVTMGDGGDGSTGQTLTGDLLGTVLRIDVDGDDFPADDSRNYAIPASNPFVGITGEDEIFAYGLRNPFRANFDRQNGDLWIGDVGEGAREEIDVIRGDSLGGENFGWDACEGLVSSGACDTLKATPGSNVIDPVYDYSHNSQGPSAPEFRGVSVIGGVVYRGPDPEVHGRYLFGDVFAQEEYFWSLDAADPVGSVQRLESELFPGEEGNTIGGPVSFGEDADGNVYILTRWGGIFRIVTDATISADFDRNGVVDALDLATLLDGYGAENPSFFQGDSNVDGIVSGADLLNWQRLFTPPASLEQVPEPVAGWLVLHSVAIVFSWRGRRQTR